MIKEIYIRDPEDEKYDYKKLDISDEYEMLYSKIMMILSTRAGDVLGDPEFGMSLEDKLFTFDVSEETLKQEIYTQIQKYIPEAGKFDLKIDIKKFRGSVRDIILIDFYIDGRKSFGVMVK